MDPKNQNPSVAIRKVAEVYTPKFLEKFSRWARETNMTIVTGSWPELQSNGTVTNTSYVMGADGAILHRQAKTHLTETELKDYQFTGEKKPAAVFELPGR